MKSEADEAVATPSSHHHTNEPFPPGWYVIAEAREVAEGKPSGFDRFGTRLVVWRKKDGTLAALDDRCPHRGASLALGTVQDDCVTCPFHGFAFESKGSCVRLPVLGPEAKIPKALASTSYEIREVDQWLWLWWGPKPADGALPPVPSFEHLQRGYSHRTMSSVWNASYVRVIENQLDPFHLPFVHRTTIGRGMNPQMTIHSDVGEHHVLAWPGEPRDNPRSSFYIEFRWANLWENHISDRMSIVAAFVPLTHTKTKTYLRTYQSFVTFPVLGALVDLLIEPMNHKIFAQDQQVVESQPQQPFLAEGELLIKPDGPIIAFRKMFARALGHTFHSETSTRG